MIINHLFTTLYYNVDVENIVVVIVIVVARMKLKTFFSFLLLYIHSLLYYLPVFHSSGLKRWNCSVFKKFSFYFSFHFFLFHFIYYFRVERTKQFTQKAVYSDNSLSYLWFRFLLLSFFSYKKVWLFVVVVVFLRKKTVNEKKNYIYEKQMNENFIFIIYNRYEIHIQKI